MEYGASIPAPSEGGSRVCFRGRTPYHSGLILSLLLLALALPSSAHAQRLTGELSGTVVDESGGVIPGAAVTLVNQASGSTRETVTNAEGFFVFSAVPAATFRVTIALSGFKTYERTDIDLLAGDSRTLRTVTLELGGMEERVSVSSEIALTPVNSGEKTATLTATQIENVAMVGRNAAELLKILPGATPLMSGGSLGLQNRPNFTGEVVGVNGNGLYSGGGPNNQSATGNYSANGTPVAALDITVDGAPSSDPGCNCAESVNPNPDMVQEFRVLQANFGAEHARGPVHVSVVSKQGGRDFHGSVQASLRHYELNSNWWFRNKLEEERVQDKFLSPGFTLSGPLLIPGTGFNKDRDKAFFFLGYEYDLQRLDVQEHRSWVPTEAMRAGDFSQADQLGLSGRYINSVPRDYPGGVIPPEEWDRGGQVLLDAFPLPNADPAVTGGYNYVEHPIVDNDMTQLLARVDFNLSPATKLYLRYNRQRQAQEWPFTLWYAGPQTVPYPAVAMGEANSDSGTVSLTHVFDPSLTSETVFGVTYIRFPNELQDRERASRQAQGYPYQGIFGESGDLLPNVFMNPFGPEYLQYGGFDPRLGPESWQYSIQSNLTKVAGTHTLKLGLFLGRVKTEQGGSGVNHGNAGLAAEGWVPNTTGNTFADLLLGRLVDYGEQTENVLRNLSQDRIEGFVQDSWRVSSRFTVDLGVRVSYLGPWTDRVGSGLAAWDINRYDPDAPPSALSGVVWHGMDSSMPPAGVDRTPLYVTPRGGFAWDLGGSGRTVLRGGLGVYRYPDPYVRYLDLVDLPAGVRWTWLCCGLNLGDLENLAEDGELLFQGHVRDRNDNAQPLTWSWSLTMNQSLPWSLSVEAGYVGSRSDDLYNYRVADFNAVPFGAMLDNPYDPNQDSYRPLPNYSHLYVYRHSLWRNYNSFQALLSRQRGSFNLTLAYTFSKNLGVRGEDVREALASEYVLDQRTHNYGVLGSDRTHVATLSWSWLLPEVGEGLVNTLFGSWQIAGISNYVSGAPLQTLVPNFNINGTLADGTEIANTTITGSPDIPAQPVLLCDPTENVPSDYLFNPECFAPPSPGVNGSYVMPYMKGQPYINHDLSLTKNFPFSNGHRLQLRLSAYNVFNHPTRYPDPNTNLTLHFTNGVLDDPNGDFGRLPNDNKYGRRIVQIAVRYSF